MFIFSFLFFNSLNVIWIIFLFFIFISLLLIDWKTLLACSILIALFLIGFYFIHQNLNLPSKLNENLVVNKVLTNGVIVNKGFNKIFIKTNLNLMVDDLVQINSNSINKINSNKQFDNYLRSEGVHFISGTNTTIEKLITIPTLKQNIYNYLFDGPHFYKKYVPISLIGYKSTYNLDIYEKLKSNSIIHLFVISGFHINFWVLIINKICKSLKLTNKYVLVLIPMLLLFYLWLLDFSISSIRAFIFGILIIINKNFLKEKYKKTDLLSFSMLLVFLSNPFIVYSLSFIFSFIISYVILLSFNFSKRFLKIKISLVAWISSLILITFINKTISLNGLVNNYIFTPIIIFLYFVTSLFFYIKPLIDNLYFLFDIILNIFVISIISFKLEIDFYLVILLYALLFMFLIIKSGYSIKNEFV